jgi:hypothetical protein
MPLNLPNLDDLTWEGLTEEARSLIVSWAPEWTNHNASDPGITLVELFAYLSEILIYRTNKIGESNVRQFLKLINGPKTDDKITGRADNLHQDKLKTVLEMGKIQRAVTIEDFEKLALDAGVILPSGERVARVKCVPRRNLERKNLNAHNDDAPSHVSLVVLSSHHSHPSQELLKKLRRSLEPARLLTTQLHVVHPRYLSVNVRIALAPYPGTVGEKLKKEAIDAVKEFFDPLKGGADHKGWPLGRNIHVSEIYQLLDDLPGVDYVTRGKHSQTGEELDALAVKPIESVRLRRNKLGQLEDVEVYPDELISIQINNDDLSIIPVGA